MKTNATGKTNIDAVTALSNIAFSSVERLAALNFKVARASVENTLAVSATALKATSEAEQKDLLATAPAAVTNSALEYLQGVQEIAADTQQDVTKLLTFYLSQQGDAAPFAAWTRGFDVFKGFTQQSANMTETNTRNAIEAAGRATRSVTAQARKTA